MTYSRVSCTTNLFMHRHKILSAESDHFQLMLHLSLPFTASPRIADNWYSKNARHKFSQRTHVRKSHDLQCQLRVTFPQQKQSKYKRKLYLRQNDNRKRQRLTKTTTITMIVILTFFHHNERARLRLDFRNVTDCWCKKIRFLQFQ